MVSHRSEVLPALVCLVAALLFFLCTYLVFSKTSEAWDSKTFLLVDNSLPNSPLSTIMVYFSQYGREVVFTAVLFVLGFSRRENHRRAAFLLLVTLIVLSILGPLAKYEFARARPDEVFLQNAVYLLSPVNSPSFPSGHSFVVAALTTVLWFSLDEKKFVSLLTIDAGFVCFSRVYVGAHFPMDVIAGVCFGIAIGGCVATFQKKLDRPFRKLDVRWRRNVLRHIEIA